MTDSDDKNSTSEKGGSSGSNTTPEKNVVSDNKGSSDKGENLEKPSMPSTLEKAVAKVSKERKADPKETEQEKAAANGSKTSTFTPVPAAPKRSPFRRRVIGGLSLVVFLAIAYLAWPLWGPMLPGSMQSSVAPILGQGPQTDVAEQIARFAAQIEPLEKEISGLKAEFANRSVADPARLLALDDLVRQNGERLAAFKTEIDTLRQSVGGANNTDAIASLSKRLDDLEVRLVTLTAQPEGASRPDATAAIAALDALRTESSERMSALERENTALRDIVALLDKRVGAIEQKPTSVPGTSRGNALVLAVGQLREAARGTAPFAVALQAVAGLADSQESLAAPLAVLKSHAKEGVPDLIALRVKFNQIAGRIAHETFVPKGEGWVDRTLGSLSRVFTFRRTGTEAATTDDENGRVARAELQLVGGDLAAAVSVMEGLVEPALGYAGPWLKEARARLQVDAAIKALFSEALAMSRVPSDGKGPPGG